MIRVDFFCNFRDVRQHFYNTQMKADNFFTYQTTDAKLEKFVNAMTFYAFGSQSKIKNFLGESGRRMIESTE